MPSSQASASTASRRPHERQLDDLLVRVGEGDSAAFDDLHSITNRQLSGVVLKILRGASHAEEVTQELYLQIWSQASRFEPQKGTARAWMTTMARRRAIDRVRTVQAAVVRESRYTAGQHVRDIDDVWERVSDRIDAEAVRSAVLNLSPKQRQAVVMAYLEGRTAVDIASAIDVAVGTVKTRTRDGLTNLRAQLGAARTGGAADLIMLVPAASR